VTALIEVATRPSVIGDWRDLLTAEHDNAVLMVGAALLVFPKLALGLSGFETGVMVMPLISSDNGHGGGGGGGDRQALERRIANTKRLLTTAAIIMSVKRTSASSERVVCDAL